MSIKNNNPIGSGGYPLCIDLSMRGFEDGQPRIYTDIFPCVTSREYKEPRLILEVTKMSEVCGNCKYNKRDFSKPQNGGYATFCCGNEDSDNYGVPTFFDDTCDDYEEKE